MPKYCGIEVLTKKWHPLAGWLRSRFKARAAQNSCPRRQLVWRPNMPNKQKESPGEAYNKTIKGKLKLKGHQMKTVNGKCVAFPNTPIISCVNGHLIAAN